MLNVLVNVMEFGMSLREAVDWPRVISRNDGPTDLELGLWSDVDLVTALIADGAYCSISQTYRARHYSVYPLRLTRTGYEITSDWGDRPLGYVQGAIFNDDGSVTAVADKRMTTGSAMAVSSD